MSRLPKQARENGETDEIAQRESHVVKFKTLKRCFKMQMETHVKMEKYGDKNQKLFSLDHEVLPRNPVKAFVKGCISYAVQI